MLSPSFPGWQSEGRPAPERQLPASGRVPRCLGSDTKLRDDQATGSIQEGLSGSPDSGEGEAETPIRATWERAGLRVVPAGHTGTSKNAAENPPQGTQFRVVVPRSRIAAHPTTTTGARSISGQRRRLCRIA